VSFLNDLTRKYRIEQPQHPPKPTSPSQRKLSAKEDYDIKLFNNKASIENLQKAAKDKGINTTVGTKARVLAGIDGRVKTMIDSNTFIIDKDGNIQITGEGLKPIIQDALKMTRVKDPREMQKDLNDYMIAVRYKDDLQKRGDVYVSKEQLEWADDTLKELENKYGDFEKLKQIAKRIYTFQYRVLYQYVNEGILSQK
jgi:hypothetical protein